MGTVYVAVVQRAQQPASGHIVAKNEMKNSIDIHTLHQLDAEADTLIQNGQWTQENFQNLWQKGLSASQGQTKLLEFLRMAAVRSWLPEESSGESGGGFSRIPSKVTEAIYRLMDGWQPRVILSRSDSLEWDGERIPSAKVNVFNLDREARNVRLFSHLPAVPGEATRWIQPWMRERKMKQPDIEELPGFGELFKKTLDAIPLEERLAGLTPAQALGAFTPEQVILALPLATRRTLPAEHLSTLSAEVQEQIRRRLQEAAHGTNSSPS